MQLEPNMYVRTKWGYICELININDFREPSMKYGVEANYLKDIMFIGDEDIENAKHSLIELVKVGDYVNGFKVNAVYDDYVWNSGEYGGAISFHEEDIKSIVTKEQFEAMQYEIK